MQAVQRKHRQPGIDGTPLSPEQQVRANIQTKESAIVALQGNFFEVQYCLGNRRYIVI